VRAAAEAHPGQRIVLWFMDEARIGQCPSGDAQRQGTALPRWWLRGRRPPGCCGRRFKWACLFAAVPPATGADVALVLPEATTRTMSLFLVEFSRNLAKDVHAVLVLDRAGWHGARTLTVPANITLVPLPPYSPELNPIERIWLYLRERFLSLRLFKDYPAIVDACCDAWNRLIAEPGWIHSLCHPPWITTVTS
jgi:transposase